MEPAQRPRVSVSALRRVRHTAGVRRIAEMWQRLTRSAKCRRLFILGTAVLLAIFACVVSLITHGVYIQHRTAFFRTSDAVQSPPDWIVPLPSIVAGPFPTDNEWSIPFLISRVETGAPFRVVVWLTAENDDYEYVEIKSATVSHNCGKTELLQRDKPIVVPFGEEESFHSSSGKCIVPRPIRRIMRSSDDSWMMSVSRRFNSR